MTRAVVLAVCLLLLAGSARAEPEPERRPLLWILEGDTPVYLFGTIHVPDPRVTDLPDAVEQAFEASDVFYAELDMAPGAMASVQHLLMLPEDESLDEILGQELFGRMTPFLVRGGLPAMVLARLKPWVVAIRLLAQALMPEEPESAEEESGSTEQEDEPDPPKEAMDMALYRNAVATGKKTGGLETLEEQIHVFDALERPDQIEMIEGFLDVLEARDDPEDESDEQEGGDALLDGYEELVRLYLAGDVEGLGKAIHRAAEGDSEALKEFLHRMFDERNVRMADRILQFREEAPGKTLFVAVGAGHYAGETGILALLRAKGETLRRVENAGELVPGTKEPAEAR